MKVPADHIGKATASHDEEGAVNKDAKLSGLSYLRLVLRDEDVPGLRKGFYKRTSRVLVREPKFCNHGVTICEECAMSWSWDYEIYFDSTEGGRRLKAKLDELDVKIETSYSKLDG